MMSPVRIFMIRYKSPELEEQCISKILLNTYWPYRLTVYDNSIRDEKNTAKIWNELVRQSDEPYICFIDSDAVPEKGWLSELMRGFALPEVGAAVPRTNSCGELRQVQVREGDGCSFLDWHASGFCFVFSRIAYHEVGPFDEIFKFYGQDSEWFARMYYKTEYKTWMNPKSFVMHIGGGSTKSIPDSYDFLADKKAAEERFWSKLGEFRRSGKDDKDATGYRRSGCYAN